MLILIQIRFVLDEKWACILKVDPKCLQNTPMVHMGYTSELKSLPIELMHHAPLVLQIAFLFCIWIISMIIIEIRCRFGLDPIPCKRKFIGSIMTSYQACACHVHGGTMGVPLSTFFLYLSSTTENTFCFFFIIYFWIIRKPQTL